MAAGCRGAAARRAGSVRAEAPRGLAATGETACEPRGGLRSVPTSPRRVPKAFASPGVLQAPLASLPPCSPEPCPHRPEPRRGAGTRQPMGTTRRAGTGQPGRYPVRSWEPCGQAPQHAGDSWGCISALGLCSAHRQQVLKSWLWH